MATRLPALSGQLVPYGGPSYDPETTIRGKLRLALIAIAVLVFGIGSAAAFVPIGGAVMGGGSVAVESRVKRVAHPTGGIISEIYVKNGDHVEKGEILMRLDDTVSGADAQLSELSVDQLLAQRARLEAERLGASGMSIPAELRRNDPGARKALADEQKLFAIRQAEQAGIRAQLTARIAQNEQQIASYGAQINAMRQQTALIEPERKGVRDLWEKDLVTISRLNQLERTQVDLQGQIAALNAQIAQTQARITEAREQLIQLGQTRRSEAGTQLAQVNAALNQQQVRSVSAGDVQERSVIRAPYAGTVDKLAFATIGDVVRPAETIMEIVPDDDKLVVEAMVSPADIDQVRAGQPARIRFSAFSATSTPEIPGRVAVVAAERTDEERTGASYYQVRLEIDEAALSQQRRIQLKPGMPAEVYIETGNRSMLSYLTKPLSDQLARSFNDNN
ncbi:HlyD family type I secretion periplasmic adaptor subunit [Sphingomonas lenta]|uniref:Membrane fusion protein (MFP) family protein n=1 Tax=Sphingomonas lenta TaxID=1141887 RepID=A0A2A2SEZ4_9SPHN|nr:HlyD family type I secretion periplasmic adaptor subunit [Sphingomonas lenta]PAX07773.1 secretion protein HlyD [Sphingomonas lenta]